MGYSLPPRLLSEKKMLCSPSAQDAAGRLTIECF